MNMKNIKFEKQKINKTEIEDKEYLNGSSNIEMGKKRYENIIFSFSYAIISMQVVY